MLSRPLIVRNTWVKSEEEREKGRGRRKKKREERKKGGKEDRQAQNKDKVVFYQGVLLKDFK